jgi:hypothetical protein
MSPKVILPNEIFENIVFGYLNDNILDFINSKSLEILQNAVIIENSSRRIVNRNYMNLSKSELMSFILLKKTGLKNMRWYIKLAEDNLMKIQSCIEDQEIKSSTNRRFIHVFNLNNGFTHKYYTIIEANQEFLNCQEIGFYKYNEKMNEVCISHSVGSEILLVNMVELKTAIYLEGHSQYLN